jgi:hypothetical protein
MNELEHYFEHGEHRRIVKWRHYFEIYERHLCRFRWKPITLLEIGVFQGGSLQMWQHYFGPSARIIGLDSDPRCRAFAGGNIECLTGDQADRDLLRSAAAQAGGFDIVIDDGGHQMYQQIVSFEELYPQLRDPGVYICEDLHTSYWKEYGGGLRTEGTFVEFAKQLIDELNARHTVEPHKLVPTAFTQSASSLHFYDSVLVVEKRRGVPPEPCDKGSCALT